MADVTGFPISTDMAGALVRLEPGGMRQLHWHTNLDEWQYVINGTIQVSMLHARQVTEPVSSAPVPEKQASGLWAISLAVSIQQGKKRGGPILWAIVVRRLQCCAC